MPNIFWHFIEQCLPFPSNEPIALLFLVASPFLSTSIYTYPNPTCSEWSASSISSPRMLSYSPSKSGMCSLASYCSLYLLTIKKFYFFDPEWVIDKYWLKRIIIIFNKTCLLFYQLLEEIALPIEFLLSEFQNHIQANRISSYDKVVWNISTLNPFP